MTDEELAAARCPDDAATGLRIVATFTPEKRATYERLVTLGDEINLWSAGVGPKPAGVIVCGPRQIRAGRT